MGPLVFWRFKKRALLLIQPTPPVPPRDRAVVALCRWTPCGHKATQGDAGANFVSGFRRCQLRPRVLQVAISRRMPPWRHKGGDGPVFPQVAGEVRLASPGVLVYIPQCRNSTNSTLSLKYKKEKRRTASHTENILGKSLYPTGITGILALGSQMSMP